MISRLACTSFIVVVSCLPAIAQVRFYPYSSYGVPAGPPVTVIDLTVGDFDGDGRPDVAAAFNQSGGTGPARVAILRNGQFQAPVTTNPGVDCWLHNIAEIQGVDVDHDGHLDLVMTEGGSGNGCFGNKFTVQLGDGHGGFASPGTAFTTGGSDGHFVADDFDRDGNVDLAIACRDDGATIVHLGDGAGGFGSGTSVPGFYPDSPFIAHDLNGDGDPDIVAAIPSQNAVKVLYGSAGASFSAPVSFGVTNPFSVAWGDFDENGIVDVIALSGSGCTVLPGLGGGAFGTPIPSTGAAGGTSAIVVADFDLDGHLDVATHSAGSASVYVATGNGDGTFDASQAFAVAPAATPCCFLGSLRGGDFDGDGRPDLVAAEVVQGGISLLRNQSCLADPCAAGVVDAGAGGAGPVDVLTINGSAGGACREVVVRSSDPFTLDIAEPPSRAGRRAYYWLGAWSARPFAMSAQVLPEGIGTLCLPMRLTGGAPQPRFIANNIGHPGVLGSENWPARFAPTQPAPYRLLNLPGAASVTGRTTFFQGIIIDDRSPSPTRRLSVTNGILLTVVP